MCDRNMKPLSKDEFRENIIFVVFKNYAPLLRAIKEKPNATYNELKKLTGYSNGLVYNTLKDLKILELVNNGYGLTISGKGSELLSLCGEDNMPPKEFLKDLCMKIPIFSEIYQENPLIKDYKYLIERFSTLLPKGTNRRIVSSVTKRYLEAFHGVRIKQGSKISRINRPSGGGGGGGQPMTSEDIIDRFKFVHQIKNLPFGELVKRYGKDKVKELLDYV